MKQSIGAKMIVSVRKSLLPLPVASALLRPTSRQNMSPFARLSLVAMTALLRGSQDLNRIPELRASERDFAVAPERGESD